MYKGQGVTSGGCGGPAQACGVSGGYQSGACGLSPGAEGAMGGVWAEQGQIGVVFHIGLRRTKLYDPI